MSKHSKSKLRKLSTIILTLIVSAAAALAGESSSNSDSHDQLPAGPMREKAEAACSTCHEARIIVQQRLSKPAWIKEVDKMIKWGAEVDPKDRDSLIDYFSSNFGPDQSAYTAPRSAAQSTVQTKAKK
jgi:competence protein ComEA